MLRAFMYLRNFGPALAFLIRSRIVLVWASSIVPPVPSSSSPTTTILKMLHATYRRRKELVLPTGLHVRLAARSVERGRHIGIFVMAARQVLQPAADQDAAAPARFVGIGEIHPLFRQQRAQMFVDLLERRVFEGFIRAILWIAFLDVA